MKLLDYLLIEPRYKWTMRMKNLYDQQWGKSCQNIFIASISFEIQKTGSHSLHGF